MAIKEADATGKRLMGLSTDEWPLGREEGTELHIIDTGEQYIFCDGIWVRDLRKINAIKMAEKLAIS